MLDIISNFSVFLISEPKFDSFFPNSQFKINGYKIFRRYRNRYGGGFLFICKGRNRSPLLAVKLLLCNFFETKRKWFLLGIYKPPKQDISEFLLKN